MTKRWRLLMTRLWRSSPSPRLQVRCECFGRLMARQEIALGELAAGLAGSSGKVPIDDARSYGWFRGCRLAYVPVVGDAAALRPPLVYDCG